ncbi:hypothetical protein F2Q68_00027662, partial [Brassica cretica]
MNVRKNKNTKVSLFSVMARNTAHRKDHLITSSKKSYLTAIKQYPARSADTLLVERINDGSNGSVADDSFHLYKEDVALLHQIGFNAYRFSISWSRILPRGNLKGGINEAGIDYYNNLINELFKGKNTLSVSHYFELRNDFRDYADICFKNFGDRVKHWMTLNEPLAVVQQGYVAGGLAPGRCSKFTNPNCTGGDGATEPYIVGHNLILAHGAAVKVYREKYKPFVTIFHWDTPQSLEDAYGGFLGAKIVNDFRDYADICFKNFGDRVKHWMTLNEPLAVVQQGYVAGGLAPGRCSKFTNPNCTGGDGATEPYIVGHNLILAHGAAVKVYREKYKESQKGKVGIALNAGWYLPYTESAEDRLAVARVMAFTIDYFLEPLVTGKYPVDMVNNVKGGRLPTFTTQQSKMLKGSYDFIGINYYSSAYAKDVPCSNENVTLFSDPCASVTGEREGVPIGPKAASDWILIYPKGIRDLLLYAKYKFKDPVMYITENGRDEFNTGKIFLNDGDRIDFYARHLEMVQDAISIGANVKGFFAWSLLDNFEWIDMVKIADSFHRHQSNSFAEYGQLMKKGVDRSPVQLDTVHSQSRASIGQRETL